MITDESHIYLSIHWASDERISPQYDPSGLEKLGRINLFIGSNSSGKSRLLRGIACNKELPFTTRYYSEGQINSFFSERLETYDDLFENERGRILTEVGGLKQKSLRDTVRLAQAGSSPEPSRVRVLNAYKQIAAQMSALDQNSIGLFAMNGLAERAAIGERTLQSFTAWGKETAETIDAFLLSLDLPARPRIYVPTLRGMRPPDDDKDAFMKRTKRDYPELEAQVMFTGLSIYTDLRRKLLGEPQERDAVRDYERFLSENFFRSKPVSLIPKEGTLKQGHPVDTVHIKIGDDKQFPVYDLGDGMQSLIIATYPVFLATGPSFFFFEEPDLAMHPGLQRALIEALLENKQHQYFMTTHSNHLLDLTMDYKDISVFHFKRKTDEKEPKFRINCMSSRDRAVLEDLGVRNSSVFLTNATIWVEGVTDRKYLRIFMKKFLADDRGLMEKFGDLKEDFHYSFVEYQGSNLDHWTFADEKDDKELIKAVRLCSTAIVIADGDVKLKGNRAERFERDLGDRFSVLPCKEIENLVPEAMLRKFVEVELSAAAVDPDKISASDYSASDKGIGKYLDDLLNSKDFGEESTTLKRHKKLALCDKCVAYAADPDFEWQLTAPARDLCGKVFEHILQNNPIGRPKE